MDTLLKLCFLFFIGSLFGWGIEVFFRRFFSPAKKWINPGFLNGPYLPLYGFGTCLLYFLSELSMPMWQRLILFCVLLTVLEYITGVIFIRILHIKLWDYSKLPFNFQGIVSPLFSLFWTLLGLAFYLFIFPHLSNAVGWLFQNLAFSFFIGMFFGVLLVDFGTTVGLSAKIKKLSEKQVVVYEHLKLKVRHVQEKLKKRPSFFLPFKSDLSLHENVKEYIEELIAAIKRENDDTDPKEKK